VWHALSREVGGLPWWACSLGAGLAAVVGLTGIGLVRGWLVRLTLRRLVDDLMFMTEVKARGPRRSLVSLMGRRPAGKSRLQHSEFVAMADGYWLLSTLFSAGLAGSFLLVRRTPTGFGSARSPQLVWLLFGVYGVTAVGMLGRGLASASRSEVELFTKPLGFRAQFWLKSQARIRLRSTQESAPKKPTRYSVSWPDGIGGVAVTRLAAVAAYRPVLLAAGGAFLGGMKDAFRGPSRRFALRLLAVIPLRVSSTASFTKALGGIALIVVAMVLAATGHFLPQNAPAWPK
jgi:hypothetical protein